MKYEPSKILKGIDLTCFEHVHPKRWHRENSIFVVGTSEAYFQLIPFFENLLEMSDKFGSATKEIFFSTPAKFNNPITVPSEDRGYLIQLHYFKSLKIKLLGHQVETELTRGDQLKVVCSRGEIEIAIATCHKRLEPQTHGLHFFSCPSSHITSQPLGDWLAIE